MNDYNKLFCDLQEISAFDRRGNLFEGRILIKKDGSKVVLNEETNKIKNLKDLKNIKLVGTHLYEDAISDFKTIVGGYAKDLDPEKVRGKEDVIKTSLEKVTQDALDREGKPRVTPEDSEKIINDYMPKDGQLSQAVQLEKAADNASETGGDLAKAQSVIEEYKTEQKNLNESLKLFRPELQKLFEEVDELEPEDTPDEKYNLLSDEEKEEVQDEAADYEDDDYQNISDETKEDLIQDAMNQVENHLDDLEDYLKDNYEITEDEANQYALEALTKVMNQDDPEHDEIEKEFEDAIDEVESGDNGDILEHIVDKFEIPIEDAEQIAESCGWKPIDMICKLCDYVYGKRKRQQS